MVHESFYPKSNTGKAIKKEIRNLFDVLGNIRAQNGDLDPVKINEERENAKSEADGLRKELNKVQKVNAKLQVEFKNFEDRNAKLSQQLSNAKIKLSKCQQFKANVEAKLSKSEKLNNNLLDKLDKVNQEKQDLELRYNQDQQHFRVVQRDLEKKVVELDRQLHGLRGQDMLVDVVEVDQPLDLTFSLPSQHHVTEETDDDLAHQYQFLPTQDVDIENGGNQQFMQLSDGRVIEMLDSGNA